MLAGSILRMAGQMGYLLLSSFTMNENLFAVMVANVHNLMVRGKRGSETAGQRFLFGEVPCCCCCL